MSGFLCAMVGATFVTVAAQVLRSKKGITAIGNAQVSTAQSKFGGSSLLMDGSGDRLNVIGEVLESQYTVEYWFRASSFSNGPTLVDFRGGGNDNYSDYITSGGVFTVFINGADRIQTSALSTNTWYHIAVVRDSSSDIKLYLNGTKTGNTYNQASYSLNTAWYIGDNFLFVSSLNGYMDEIRISKVARYTAAFTAPTQPFVNDDNTVLLVHANGTNSSTFFEDDNGATTIRTAKTITVNGNAQVSTAQSKFGGASALFDGTGDYLIVPASNDFAFGTSPFTIELWFRRIADASGVIDVIVGNRNEGFGSGNFVLYHYNNTVEFDYRNDIVSNNTLTTAISNATWYHIALVRNGTSLTLYKDGAVGQTKTIGSTETFGSSSYDLSIGCNTVGTFPLNGYIDELRISNVARYTAAFTAPITAFENDANTLLLIHADGSNAAVTFTDDNNSRSAKGIAAVGNAKISTAQSKFGGSSILFDGSGDYLTLGAGSVTPNTALSGRFWTVEYWARITSHVGGYQATVAIWNDVTGVGNTYYFSTNMYDSTQRMGFQYFTTSDSGALAFGTTLATGVWQHHAFVRNGDTMTAYLDGVSKGTRDMTGQLISMSGNANGTNINTVPVTIGGMSTGAGSFNGYLEEVRISNTARYTAAFTAPTAPFVNDANTVLLIHGDGTNNSTVFRDDNGIIGSTPKVITANGNAQISTAQSQFGGSSAVFDGTGDYLQLGHNADLNFGTNNFTVEFWINFTNKNNAGMFSNGTATYTTDSIVFGNDGGTSSFGFFHNPGGRLCHIAHSDFNTSTWYHIAATRSGNTFTMYLNGVAKGSSTYSGTINFNANNATRIGMATWESPTGFTGYIDEFRISNSARYTANFTPSTTAFTQDSNTVLLIHADGANASTTFRDDSGRTQKGVQAIGNAQVSTAQSKFGGASSLYDGNGDYLQLANSSDYNFTGNYTIEGWWYQPSNVAAGIYPTLIGTGAVSDNKGWAVTSEPTTNKILFITSGDGSSGMQVLLTSASLSAATWNHWAVVRNNSVLTVYINGTASGSTYTTTGNSIASTYPLYIGGGVGGLSSGNFSSSSATVVNLNGYQDEIRLSNTARYTAAFTPSTTPFQNDDNTVLLLHMDGTNASTVFFDDNGAKPYTL